MSVDYSMYFWIKISAIVILLLFPFIIKVIYRRSARKSDLQKNQAWVKWRKLDITSTKSPFTGWFSANSGLFHVSENGISCSNVQISKEEVLQAMIYSPNNSPLGKDSLSILRVLTNTAIYDFSINPYKMNEFELPFEVELSSSELTPIAYKRLSIIIIFVVFIFVFVIHLYFNH